MISAYIARLAAAEHRALPRHLPVDVIRLVGRGTADLPCGRRIVPSLVHILLRQLPLPEIIVVCGVAIEFGPFLAQVAALDDLLAARLHAMVGVLGLVHGLAFELLPGEVLCLGGLGSRAHLPGLVIVVDVVGGLFLEWACVFACRIWAAGGCGAVWVVHVVVRVGCGRRHPGIAGLAWGDLVLELLRHRPFWVLGAVLGDYVAESGVD